MKKKMHVKGLWTVIMLAFMLNLLFSVRMLTASAEQIQPLTIQGQDFVDPAGNPVRFWGINLVALYPTHDQADKLAANLASLQVNVVRPHHNLRNSLDWNSKSGIGSLLTYNGNSRTPNVTAWDRFDYLNAKLRENGIYLRPSLDSTRSYLPGDVDIITTTDSDRTAWMNAMAALNQLPSDRNMTLRKILPMIDERVARLDEEFVGYFLTHTNPYTGVQYGQDPQLLTLEVMNEVSTEYSIVCGNNFRDSNSAINYWDNILTQKWNDYCNAHSVARCDLYNPSTAAQKNARTDFLEGLDSAYFTRMKNYVRNLGCQTPITFSNLWRSETATKMNAQTGDYMEDHFYQDPFAASTNGDVFANAVQTTMQDKPYFVGELNQDFNVVNKSYRTMLTLAAAAYGAFNNWSGINFFAWEHGDRYLGTDGWSTSEVRTPSDSNNMIGEIQTDGMIIDHLRTAGILFRQGLVSKSSAPVVMYVDDPKAGQTNYNNLIVPKYQPIPGWQDVHSIRKAYGTVPASQNSAPWMTGSNPPNPVVSDTNEISKDITRKQLSISAPKAEAFSGLLDAQAPAKLSHIAINSTSGFATVILVSNDGKDLASSNKLVISRTQLDSGNNEINSTIKLKGLAVPGPNMQWILKVTRSRSSQTDFQPLSMTTPGELQLPSSGWHECELQLVRNVSPDNLRFTNAAGTQITNVTGLKAGDAVIGRADITNNTADNRPVSIVMALYDGNKLLQVSTEKAWVSPGSNAITHPGLLIPPGSGNYRFKLFVWDSLDGGMPLSKSAELK